MQRPTTETIREQCQAIANVAEPHDTTRTLAAKVLGLSIQQLSRRLLAMERDLGLEPADPSNRGQGRRPADGSERQHSHAGHRRAGEVARTWRRRHSL